MSEQSNKKMDYINRKIKNQAKMLMATEKDYIAIKNEFGEASQKTQTAYQQYLEAQTEQQKLINELNQAQLDAYDSKVSYLEKQEKLVTNRQNMLAKLYGDGNLAGREDAYKAAVEQYGADSVQARKAATQGTMTAIIGVGSALDSMSYSLKKVTNKEITGKKFTMTVKYNYYLPTGFDALTGRLKNSLQYVEYNKTVDLATLQKEENKEEFNIGFDYLLINHDNEASIPVTIEITNESKVVVARYQNLKVPHQRNKETNIRGYFLTASPGISFDPDFNDDDIIIDITPIVKN